jgi:hypothetical protein
MKATMILADAAQAIENKLYLLGGGWVVTGPEPSPFAIAILIEVPLEEAGRSHQWGLTLLDEEGVPVRLPALNEQALTIGGDFVVGKSPDHPIHVPLTINIAINSGPIQYPPGRSFTWQLSIDGRTDSEWQARFSTRPVS